MSVQPADDRLIPWHKTVPYEWKFWRTDLKTMIAAVLWGVVVTVLLQITERLDTAIFGGTFFLFALMLVPFNVGFVLFGLPGALITGWISPIFAVLLASAPLGPWFFLTNGMHMLFGTIAFSLLKKKGEGTNIGQMVISGIAAIIGLTLPWLYVWPVVVGMTTDVVIKFAAILVIEGAIFYPLLSFFVIKRALKTGLWP